MQEADKGNGEQERLEQDQGDPAQLRGDVVRLGLAPGVRGWCGRPGIGQAERAHADEQVHQRGTPEARPDADVLDEEEPGERRARHRTERVEAVQAAQ